MVSALLSLLVFQSTDFAGQAYAQAMTVGPTAGVVGQDEMGLRPGLRVGFEPSPSAALELVGNSGMEGDWDGGLSLSGRWYMSPSQEVGSGLFLLGRFTAGVSGTEAGMVGPWTGLAAGFGGRPVPMLDISASAGPEWVATGGSRWRTELGFSLIISGDSFGRVPGSGSVWHRPRPIPGR